MSLNEQIQNISANLTQSEVAQAESSVKDVLTQYNDVVGADKKVVKLVMAKHEGDIEDQF